MLLVLEACVWREVKVVGVGSVASLFSARAETSRDRGFVFSPTAKRGLFFHQGRLGEPRQGGFSFFPQPPREGYLSPEKRLGTTTPFGRTREEFCTVRNAAR